MKLGITMLVHNKDDIEFVTEFPCFFWDTLYHTLPVTPFKPHVYRDTMFKIKFNNISNIEYAKPLPGTFLFVAPENFREMLPSGKIKDPEVTSDDEDVETCLRYIH